MDTLHDAREQRQRCVEERTRSRAVRACDNCRRRKEKCDGGVPCRRCLRLHRQCEFLRPSTRAGIADMKHIARSASVVELEQRIDLMERIVMYYTGCTNVGLQTLQNLAESLEGQPSQPRSLDTQSEGSELLGAYDKDITVQPLGNNVTHYSGELSHWNFSMRIKQWVERHGENMNEAANAFQIKEYYRAEELQSPSITLASLSSLPPRYVADFLVHVFFKHAETNYFYVERSWLDEKMNIAYENANSLSRLDASSTCVLFGIFAIGTQYAHLESRDDRPDEQPDDTVGRMLYQQACRLLPDVITIASLESVQACLLIGMYTLPVDASGLSYTYLNLALKLAIQNGMHRKFLGGGLDPTTRETRSRLWWSVYTIEKRIGIFHGRPTSISQADIDIEMPLNSSDLRPLRQQIYYARALATLQLNQILGRIAREISMLKPYAKHERSDKLWKLVDLQTELRTWWEGLPSETFQKDTNFQPNVSRSDMHLKLEYFLVRMFVGRPFIFPKEHARDPSDREYAPSHTITPNAADLRSILVTDCIGAAISAIDTCQMLRNSIGLARASYTEFSACRAALLAIITQCLHKKTDILSEALRNGMGLIKEMAIGCKSASSEASLIEALERAIARLDGLDDVSSSTRNSDYTSFKQWEKLWRNGPSTQELGSNSPSRISTTFPLQTAQISPESVFALRQDSISVPLETPFLGFDSNLQSFHQPVDEFSMFFEYGVGQVDNK